MRADTARVRFLRPARRCRLGLLAGVLAACVAGAPAAVAAPPVSTDDGQPGPGRQWTPGELIVRFAPGVDEAQRGAVVARAGAVRGEPMLHDMEVVRAGRDAGVAATVRALQRDDAVLWAEPNYAVVDAAAPPPVNDPFWPSSWFRRWFFGDTRKAQGQWGLRRIGVAKAWAALGSGNRWLDTKVAVIDSGVDSWHEDLQGRLQLVKPKTPLPGGTAKQGPWVVQTAVELAVNTGKAAKDHGTAVTGVLAATWNNGKGMAGVNPRTTVLPLAATDEASVARALEYAAAEGATIVNWSAGFFRKDTGSGPPSMVPPSRGGKPVAAPALGALALALDALEAKGVLVVVAAGNESSDTAGKVGGRFKDDPDTYYDLPCRDSAAFDNLVCVAATDGAEELAYFSSWGDPEITLAAPGEEILSPVFQGPQYEQYVRPSRWKSQKASPYALDDGTSLATPIVSGAFSLLEACVGPKLRAEAAATNTPYYELLLRAVRDHGIRTEFPGPKKGTTVKPLAGKVAWGGRLDVGLLFEHYGPECQPRAG